MPLVWVTGSPGAGKSTVCALLKSRGVLAIDADWEGYNHWVNRISGKVVADPPYPVPTGWLGRFSWRISRERVEALAVRARHDTGFLCGSVENEVDVSDLFDLVICLVIDSETLRSRLQARTGNAFGRRPEELAAALRQNEGIEFSYRALGATIIDGTLRLTEVVDAVITAATRITPARRRE